MISIPDEKLSGALEVHVDELFILINRKIEILALCLSKINATETTRIDDLKKEIRSLQGHYKSKLAVVNWFIKPSNDSDENSGKLESYDDLQFFFNSDRRIVNRSTVEALSKTQNIIEYFSIKKVKEILKDKPDQLETHYEEFQEQFSTLSELEIELIKFLFDYHSFTKKTEKYDAYQLASNLGVDTCLYCNRNYTLTITNDDEKIIRPEWDHFLPKSRSILLALSFYNLIPSCHICNSNLKRDKDFNLKEYFHPYLSKFDEHEVKFTYKPENPSAFNHKSYERLIIRLDTDHLIGDEKTRIENNINVFKLDEIYSHHENIAKNFMRLKRLSNGKYLESIKNDIFKSTTEEIPKTDKEVFELLHMSFTDPEFFYKHPMSKFKRDLALELKIIKE